MRAPRFAAPRFGYGLAVTGLVAAAAFGVAYDNGGYGLESRATVAIAVWWAVMVVLLFGPFQREPVSRVSLVISALLAALAVWTLASLLWSPSAEMTFEEVNRVFLYLGVFTLVTVGSSRRNLGRWADGLALAVGAVAVVGLTSRLFPGVFPEGDVPTFLPSFATRLSFPLGYWNGLAIFLALGIPLLLRVALVARSTVVRGLAVSPIPVIAAAIYLASSRGGVVCAVVGTGVFLGLTERRWSAAVAVVLSMLGAAVAIAVLLDRDELVNGPLGTDLVERQGRSAALFIALASVATSFVYGVGSRALAGKIRPAAALGRVIVLTIVVASAVGVILADPVERFRTFKATGGSTSIDRGDFVKQHLLSGGGTGRWQEWSVAVDEWRASPLVGQGAGSYESWWAQHRPITVTVKDAHSLYLEMLGELGLVGFLLVVALFGVGMSVGVRRARQAAGDARITAAALGAVFVAYGTAVAFDWMWELTAVSLLALTALALVSGSAAAPPAPLSEILPDTRRRRVRGGFGLRVVALLVAWFVIWAQAIPLLAQLEIRKSQSADSRGDTTGALRAAGAARDIQPWAATPYLQLALISEEVGNLKRAQSWIHEAIERDRRDWKLWLVSARLETKLGRVGAAALSLHRAAELNPRSPLFEGLVQEDQS